MDKETKAGIELTVIIHLVILILLLCFGIGAGIKEEHSFVLDFSRQEKAEEQHRQEQMAESVSRKVDDIISRAIADNPIRNVAVSSVLRDDRHSSNEADELYRDARKLSAELKAGYKSDIEEDALNEAVDYSKATAAEKSRKAYSGPSVLSWTLDGRKAAHLPIPAYRCYGAGEVTVVIVVDPQGNVVNAKVDEASSSDDSCLRSFAIRAARLSKFNKSMTAPNRQVGEITYSFIAQ